MISALGSEPLISRHAPDILTRCRLRFPDLERSRARGARRPECGRRAVQFISYSALGQHDPDYVDAFYGPPEWKTQAEKEKKSLDAIGAEAAELIAALAKTPTAGDEMLKLRREYLQKQVAALAARVRMLKGEKLKFDDESRALYDAVAPTFPDSHFIQIIGQLEAKIPGNGPLWQRYENWRKPFVIPKEKLDTVFQLAIKECRARTLAHVALSPNESFTVEYVTNKPWGGYNWYKGNFHSVIQVNTDLPTYIDRAVDLAAHEGYPGHHVYNSLLEKNLVRDRGWMEFLVYALFSPQSLVAEGTANFGREVAFPTKNERMKFEKEVLFPAVGNRCITCRRILRRARSDEGARLCDKRGRAKIDQRRDQRECCGAMVAEIRTDGTSSRSAAGEIYPALPKLRDQLQSRGRHGAPLHRETKRRRSRETVERIRQTAVLATITKRNSKLIRNPGIEEWDFRDRR